MRQLFISCVLLSALAAGCGGPNGMSEVYDDMDPAAQHQTFVECLRLASPTSTGGDHGIVRECQDYAFSAELDRAQARVKARRAALAAMEK